VSRRALLLLAALTLIASSAAAQGGFRVTHGVQNTTPTHVEITGTVTNDNRVDAVDVSVTVDALNSNGKRAARGIAFVTPRLRPGATASYVVKVPLVPDVGSYRAAVSSFRFMQGVEGP